MANIMLEKISIINNKTMYDVRLIDSKKRSVGTFIINEEGNEFSLEFSETLPNERIKELFNIIEPLYNKHIKKGL